MARLGEIIDGKYEVLREVGRGGMSVVYLAMDKRLNKQWAIKEFRKDKDDASKQVALKALLDEANLMKKLDHPTLPRIVDIIDDNQNVYVVMDYIEGESLNKVLDAYGAQPQEAVIEWAKQLSDVLDYLHTQNPPVIYRDMKPANIMLKPDGTVRLIDFGIAREYKEGKDGDTEAIGTRGYAAPEQFGGKGQTDARTDIYSLGVTLYHLVTGKNPAEPPYEIYPIRHWDPTLSSGFEWLIQKCTQLNPNDRYQSCAEVTYVLENLPKFEGEYKRKQKSRINLFMTTAIAAVVLAAASVGCFVFASKEKSNTYDSLKGRNTIGGYVAAMNLEPENPDAYIELAKYLGRSIEIVDPAAKNLSEAEMEEDKKTISLGDISAWFSPVQLAEIREVSPESYARINFEIGLMIWNNMISGTDKNEQNEESTEKSSIMEVDTLEAVKSSLKYFEAVINTAHMEGVSTNAGLTQKEYDLAEIYYLYAYFRINQDKIGGKDRGEFEVTETAIGYCEGIDLVDGEDGVKHFANPYLEHWDVNYALLKKIKNSTDQEMSPVLKKRSMVRIAQVLSQVQLNFCQVVDADTMETFFQDYVAALDGISGISDTDRAEIVGYLEKNCVSQIKTIYENRKDGQIFDIDLTGAKKGEAEQ